MSGAFSAKNARTDARLIATGFFGMRRDAGAIRIANCDQVVNAQIASRR
jgi:hypothetical protein